MPKEFTINTLRELANTTSFKRGQGYYRDGAVSKLKGSGGVVTARVLGSENYRVELDLNGRRLKTSCSCPYDYDGVCKHVVAVGLALLDQPALLAAAAPVQPADLAAAWAALPDTRKLEFLRAELDAQPQMAARFLVLLQPGAVVAAPVASHEPAAIAKALTELSFDEDAVPDEDYDAYYDYGDFGGYFDEILADTLEPAATEFERLLETRDVAAALRYWVAINRAIGPLNAPAGDEFGYISREKFGYGALLLEQWAELAGTANWPVVLATYVLTPTEAKALVALLREEITGSAPAGAPTDAVWEPVLLALARHVPVAEKLLKILLKSWLNPDVCQKVKMRAASTCSDDKTWAKMAEISFNHDPQVAHELLSFYYNRGDTANHRRVAEVALSRWPHQFTAHILKYFPAGAGHSLRLTALRQHCLYQQPDATILDELRELLPAAEFEKLLDQLVTRYGATAAVTHLIAQQWHRHGQTDRLLAFFQKLELLAYPHVPELIGWLAVRNPHECFEVVTHYIEQGVKNQLHYSRGRLMYEAFAGWLKAANQFAELRESVRAVIDFLREQYPALRMLHSTMKTVGLPPGLPAHMPVVLADDLPPQPPRRGRRPASKW